MKAPRLGFLFLPVLATLLTFGPLAPAARAAKGPVEILNFGNYRRDPDGTTYKPYEYAYGDWNKAVSNFRNQGTLIKSRTGKGGMGDNNAGLSLGGMTAVDLVVVVGNENHAKSLNFLLQDKDGTGHVWDLPLADKPHGPDIRFRLVLDKPDRVENAGKTPGLNTKKIAVWQLRGDNSDPNVEVMAIKLEQAL